MNDDPMFDQFWALCPRKKGKGAARTAFARACRSASAATLIDAMGRYRVEVAGRDPRFVPHPSTWLNQGRWDDEPDVAPAWSERTSANRRALVSWATETPRPGFLALAAQVPLEAREHAMAHHPSMLPPPPPALRLVAGGEG